jgi:hypothetical protein
MNITSAHGIWPPHIVMENMQSRIKVLSARTDALLSSRLGFAAASSLAAGSSAFAGVDSVSFVIFQNQKTQRCYVLFWAARLYVYGFSGTCFCFRNCFRQLVASIMCMKITESRWSLPYMDE